MNNPDQVDRTLADRMAWLCYEEEAGVQLGKEILFGMMSLFPDLDLGCPNSRGGLKGWMKVAVQGEGKPVQGRVVI